MAVYKQAYRPYDGALTSPRWRFWIPARYALEQVFAWRLILFFLALCFVPVLVGGGFIYLRHNLDVLLAFEIPVGQLARVDGTFFVLLMRIQATLAFFMAAIVGPGLVSPDLTNGALPLYLSRPLTRSEYVLGKFSALAVLLSIVTWIPVLILFLMQASLESGWLWDNLRIAGAIVVGAWSWILTVSLVALALSAWFRWRPVAGAMLFVVFFVSSGFGTVVNEVMGTSWGLMLAPPVVLEATLRWLFSGTVPPWIYPLPIWSAWLSLAMVCGASLWLLSTRVRAYEVVR
jgi:ABC-2 type transport system permease protein